MVCFTSFLSVLCLPCFPSRVHGIPLLGRIVPGRTGYGKSVFKIGKTTFKRWFEFEKIELQINLVINFSKFQYKSGCRCSPHKCQPPFCPPNGGRIWTGFFFAVHKHIFHHFKFPFPAPSPLEKVGERLSSFRGGLVRGFPDLREFHRLCV